MNDDLEVTGISRSGRVRKKSSKLMDFESPDDIETRYRRQTPVKSYVGFRQEEPQEFQESVPTPRPVDESGTASGSESDYYDNNGENADSMETDSSVSDEGSASRTPAHSLYMMEKSSKKKLIVKDGRIVGRAKAQRKDKGKTRITAYMMWAKEARNELLRKHPDMDFSAISKRLGEMWANVNYNERYLWKRRAKRFAIQKEQSTHGSNKIISNQTYTPVRAGPGRPPSQRKQQVSPATPAVQAAAPSNSSSTLSSSNTISVFNRSGGITAIELASHLRLLGESLTIIGERLKEHEGQIAVSGSVSVLLDTLLCSLAPLVSVCRAVPAIAPDAALAIDTMHNIAYIMPGL